jgi:hypothetical protein
MATYYVRADGTAANKAAATGPSTTISACMSVTTFNGETFSAGDEIILSSIGGLASIAIHVPSGGSEGNPIKYTGEPSYQDIVGPNGIGVDGKSHVELNNLRAHGSGANTAFNISGGAIGVVLNNPFADGGYGTELAVAEASEVICNNSDFYHTAGDELFTTHDDDCVVVINGGSWRASVGSILNWVDNPNVALNDVYLKSDVKTVKQVEVSGTGTWQFNRCIFDEPADQDSNYTQYWQYSGANVKYKNCVFLNITDGTYYLLFANGVTYEVINCTFLSNGNTCTAIWNYSSTGKIKNNIFVNVGTEALGYDRGTIDYNLFYNSGTVRGTHTVISDPDLSATGRLQSNSSSAYNAGIGPASDADIPNDDIDSNVRSGVMCDLGAHEYSVVKGILIARSA